MVEILVLIALTKRIGNIVAAKGRKPGGFKAMLVGFWFGGEILGLIIGFAVVGEGIGIYLFALIGAVIGAFVAFGIAKNLETQTTIPQTQNPEPPPADTTSTET